MKTRPSTTLSADINPKKSGHVVPHSAIETHSHPSTFLENNTTQAISLTDEKTDIERLKNIILDLLHSKVDDHNKQKDGAIFTLLLTATQLDSPYDAMITLQLMQLYITKFLNNVTIIPSMEDYSSKQILMQVNHRQIEFYSLTNTNKVYGIDQLDHINTNTISNEIILRDTLVRKNITTVDIILISFMLAYQMLDDTAIQLREYAFMRAKFINIYDKIKISKPVAELNALTMFFCETIGFELNPSAEMFYAHNLLLSSAATRQTLLTVQPSEIKAFSPISSTDQSSTSNELSLKLKSGGNTSSSSEEVTPHELSTFSIAPLIKKPVSAGFFNPAHKKETVSAKVTPPTKLVNSLHRSASCQDLTAFLNQNTNQKQDQKIIHAPDPVNPRKTCCTLL